MANERWTGLGPRSFPPSFPCFSLSLPSLFHRPPPSPGPLGQLPSTAVVQSAQGSPWTSAGGWPRGPSWRGNNSTSVFHVLPFFEDICIYLFLNTVVSCSIFWYLFYGYICFCFFKGFICFMFCQFSFLGLRAPSAWPAPAPFALCSLIS